MHIFCCSKRQKEPGWVAFVPFYNVYKAYKISIGKTWFWFWLVGNVILTALTTIEDHMYYSESYDSGMDGYLVLINVCCIVLGIVLTILGIIQKVKLAKAFDASGEFAVGLVFLPEIFLLILALSNQYQYHKIQEDEMI